MCLVEGAGDGQPDARAAMATVAGGVGTVEPVEKVRQVLGRHPLAGVCDAILHPLVDPAAAQGHGPARGSVAQGVVEQVAEHLSEPVGVDADLAGVGELRAQVYPRGGVPVAGDVGGRGSHVSGGHRSQRHVDPLLCLGDGGHVLGEAPQAARRAADHPERVVVQGSDARIPNLLTDKVDISCQFITVTASRAQQVAFTLPYYREGVALLLPANSRYQQIDDLKAAKGDLTVAVLQNVYAEELVHQALPGAKVDQYDAQDLIYQALDAGRADAVATDQSSIAWLLVQQAGKYKDGGYGWSPQTYACAVKRGDAEWLNFVNTALHEAMTGVEFGTYAASFKKWFGVDLPPPKIGFPVEFQ